MTTHWVTYRERCHCGLDEDHTEDEYRAYLDELERALAEAEEEKGRG